MFKTNTGQNGGSAVLLVHVLDRYLLFVFLLYVYTLTTVSWGNMEYHHSLLAIAKFVNESIKY